MRFSEVVIIVNNLLIVNNLVVPVVMRLSVTKIGVQFAERENISSSNRVSAMGDQPLNRAGKRIFHINFYPMDFDAAESQVGYENVYSLAAL